MKHLFLSLLCATSFVMESLAEQTTQSSTTQQQQKAIPSGKQKVSTIIKSSPSAAGIDTLDTTLESAYENNPEIQAQVKRLNQADEGLAQAKSGYRPTITGTASLGVTRVEYSGDVINRANPGSTTKRQDGKPNGTGQLELNQNIYAGGRTIAEVKKAESQILAERARLIETEQSIFAQAIQAFLDIITKEAEIDLYTNNLGYLKASLAATQAKYDVGEETQTSVAQAKAQLAEGEAQLETAKAEIEALRATYKRITGRNPRKLMKPERISELLPTTLEQAIQIATDTHPTVLRSKFEEAVARFEIDRVGSGLLPSLDFKASGSAQQTKNHTKYVALSSTDRTKDKQNNLEARLTLTVPIYEGGNIYSQKRQAHEAAAEKRIDIEVARRQIIEKLVEAWQTYLASKANINSYRAQVEANKVSLEGTRQEMLVGTKILLDVLTAQKELLTSQLNLVRAERNYYVQAFQVLLSIGSLTAKQLRLKVNYYNPSTHYNETKNKIF